MIPSPLSHTNEARALCSLQHRGKLERVKDKHPLSSIRQTLTHELSWVRPRRLTFPNSRINLLFFPSIPISGNKLSQGNPNFPRLLATLATDRRPETSKPDVTIDMLHDDALLEIFDSYRGLVFYIGGRWNWQTLLHVCRRWRYIVLASPRRLDLRIFCDPRTPMRKLPDFWPPIPISVDCAPWLGTNARCKDNIIAALEHRDRVFEIDLSGVPSAELEQIASIMEEPFPVLTRLCVQSRKMNMDGMPQVAVLPLPNAFLGGSAPRLQEFTLYDIAFLALPNLVLSASHFHALHLLDVPHAGYIPPQTMVTFLLALPNLKSLTIGFASPESRPLQMSPPPLTRAVLPSLTNFQFDGASEYLVDFIAQIDTPLLDWLHMTFFSDLVFDIPRLYKFLDRADGLKPFIRAELMLYTWKVVASLRSPSTFGMNITCNVSDWPLESMTRLCDQLIPLLSQVECLEIREEDWVDVLDEQGWLETVDDPDWLEILSPFVSVKSLYISDRLGSIVGEVLEKLTGERVTEVLPALQDLFIEGIRPSRFVPETISTFVSARQLYAHPIVVQCWETEVR